MLCYDNVRRFWITASGIRSKIYLKLEKYYILNCKCQSRIKTVYYIANGSLSTLRTL